MQLRLSLHEVITKSTQALRALNIPSGLDIENGKNIGWLATRGLPGLQMLVEEITTSHNTPNRRSIEINIVKDIVQFSSLDHSAFYFAQSAVDFAENGKIVNVGTCKFPLLIFAEMARREHLPFGFKIQWIQDNKINRGCSIFGKSEITINSSSLKTAYDLRLTKAKGIVIQNPEQMSGQQRTFAENGIKTNKYQWKTILSAARTVLVQDSNQSFKSAGAEINDNL